MSMNIYVHVKSISKMKKGLERVPYTIPDGIHTLRGLICTIVRQEAAAYNARGTDRMLINFLTEEKIQDQAAMGKIGFGRLYSENKADSEKPSLAAIQGFEDGLFRVLVNDTQAIRPDAALPIQEGDTLTFIRLTFLAGRLW